MVDGIFKQRNPAKKIASAADHLGWQVKNILQHETFLRGMLHSFSWRILKVMYYYSSQSQSHLMSYVVVSLM